MSNNYNIQSGGAWAFLLIPTAILAYQIGPTLLGAWLGWL